jgi:hypothetical protein
MRKFIVRLLESENKQMNARAGVNSLNYIKPNQIA